ncbi:acetyltransferase [Acinetobacter puyangensis]|uniref:Putative acetyltransferase n=1 Tax=Acinetobacter puyangensis TaxID=1096779 RepID=A0A240E802_9GAMM|nr:N-acetyltransferase [Acinetobacter puyangensis]SNX44000.1 putative acetyltransferase [Acinetobacter puyangensis]
MFIIREALSQDMQDILNIWLNASIQAHNFIPDSFWHEKIVDMKHVYLPVAKNYVIEDTHRIKGFASLLEDQDMLAALFIDPEFQGVGYGSALLNFLKTQYRQLNLNVYAENTAAVEFYQKHYFSILTQNIDAHTQHAEFAMCWNR